MRGEEYFWPAVKEKVAGRGWLAAGGIEQETEARKVLAELDGMASINPRFIPLMTQFNHAARAHIAYEERRVWPDLRAALSPSEAGLLGERLAQGGKGRAHPAAPAYAAQPGLLKAAGPAVAAACKLRDAASGRHN
jgi:hypothetical protein